MELLNLQNMLILNKCCRKVKYVFRVSGSICFFEIYSTVINEEFIELP